MKSKILTIVGTRPEIIRLSVVIKKLDSLCINILIDTGQNYSKNLNDIFWQQLELRNPNYRIDSRSNSTAEQLSKIFLGVEEIILKEKPEAALILGDTYSGLSAIICERYNIPVYHMEAGNRCWNNNVPEEKNRKIIDAVSTINLPYTNYSYDNLKKLGCKDEALFITGNPIHEVITHYNKQIEQVIVNFQSKSYCLATFHRAECVDSKNNLKNVIDGLSKVGEDFKLDVICSIHPRTKSKISDFGICIPKNLTFIDAFGFFEFIKLEKNARLILTDSGTVSEEACILDVPCVTLREVTERQELIDCGSTILSGYNPRDILKAAKTMLQVDNWVKPEGYLWYDVSNRVAKKVLE